MSGHTVHANSTSSGLLGKPQMDVVFVIDIKQNENLAARKKAFDEVRQACLHIGANLIHIQVSCIQKVLKFNIVS